MLDIIESMSYLRLQCPLLTVVNFLLPIHTPTHDHGGNEMEDQTPYIDRDEVREKQFFEIFSNCQKGERLQFAFRSHLLPRVGLSRCLPPSSCKIPNFGFKPGKIIWVSSEAMEHYGDKWQTELSKILRDRAVMRTLKTA